MSSFPQLGFHYGVFATQQFTAAISSGSILTDDEDDSGHNDCMVDDPSIDADARAIITPTSLQTCGHQNTTLHTAFVMPAR